MQLADCLAEHVAAGGEDVECLVREREAANPHFDFLKVGAGCLAGSNASDATSKFRGLLSCNIPAVALAPLNRVAPPPALSQEQSAVLLSLYYRWKVYSLVNGDRAHLWSTRPFTMHQLNDHDVPTSFLYAETLQPSADAPAESHRGVRRRRSRERGRARGRGSPDTSPDTSDDDNRRVRAAAAPCIFVLRWHPPPCPEAEAAAQAAKRRATLGNSHAGAIEAAGLSSEPLPLTLRRTWFSILRGLDGTLAPVGSPPCAVGRAAVEAAMCFALDHGPDHAVDVIDTVCQSMRLDDFRRLCVSFVLACKGPPPVTASCNSLEDDSKRDEEAFEAALTVLEARLERHVARLLARLFLLHDILCNSFSISAPKARNFVKACDHVLPWSFLAELATTVVHVGSLLREQQDDGTNGIDSADVDVVTFDADSLSAVTSLTVGEDPPGWKQRAALPIWIVLSWCRELWRYWIGHGYISATLQATVLEHYHFLFPSSM